MRLLADLLLDFLPDLLEADRVAALGQAEPQRVVPAGTGIVGSEFLAKAPGFDTHERIRLRVEIGWPIEDVDGDGIGAKCPFLAVERRCHHMAEKALQARCGNELGARQNPSESGVDGLPGR